MDQEQQPVLNHSHDHSKGHACGCGHDHSAKKEDVPFLNGKVQMILGALIVVAIAASFFVKF